MLDPYNAFSTRITDATGGPGPLSGMTVAIKANIAVHGQPFHAGIGRAKIRSRVPNATAAIA